MIHYIFNSSLIAKLNEESKFNKVIFHIVFYVDVNIAILYSEQNAIK